MALDSTQLHAYLGSSEISPSQLVSLPSALLLHSGVPSSLEEESKNQDLQQFLPRQGRKRASRPGPREAGPGVTAAAFPELGPAS